MIDKFSSNEYFEKLDKYFRAVNYVSVGQLYLLDNPLLKTKLKPEHVKNKIIGHWGTVPGQNFIYTHCNRVINKYGLNMLLVSGPGHGGNFFVANSYLEGTYSEFYPEISQDKKGLTKLFKRFSFAGGIGSHATPDLPGSIHEGGELGYSLVHSFGAVLDNPNLIVTTVVGDGEAETAPIATSWHCNKFLNPKKDGAVLPVLHLNGYKICNPTILSRISKEELTNLLKGYGYKPYFVEGDNSKELHKIMAKAMDNAIEDIRQIWNKFRKLDDTIRPIWPMIVLRTPKGWTAPKFVDGKQIEGSFNAHQVPIDMSKPNHIELLEDWLKSYKPEELFTNYKLNDDIAEILPKGEKRISANIHANGGKLLQTLVLPNLKDYAVKVKTGKTKAQDMLELSAYLRDVYKLNQNNFRMFSPDEAMSNRMHHVFESEKRDFNLNILPTDENLANNGRVMDSYLSEHVCEGLLEGYLISGRHGIFHSYEAFIKVVDSMICQHTKWLKMCNRVDWREPISSLNLLLTSNVWQQDHNGYTHQDTGFLDSIISKDANTVRIYLPADANSLICEVDSCLKTKNKVNVVVASKHPTPQWLTMDEAVKHVKQGISVWDFACVNDKNNPDIVFASAGSTPTLEAIESVKILKKYIKDINIRFVNVEDLMKLSPDSKHPHGLTDSEYNKLFTTNKPIIFNFHGNPELIHQLTYTRKNRKMVVRGYVEEGGITTPFDMRVLNKIDRYNLTMLAVEQLQIDNTLKEKIILDMQNKLKRHKEYIFEHGVDLPENQN